ncbi:MAG: hypothetical protein ACEQSK_05365 [Sphingomonadaceae bacterium]
MTYLRALRLVCCVAAVASAVPAQAESFASSASSAASASSGSISDSLAGSSNSSGGKTKVATGDYRIIQIAQLPDKAGFTRLTLQAAAAEERLTLDLPARIATEQQLATGALVHVENRVYGFEFARSDTRQAFFLALADDWYRDLAARPVGI